MADLAPILRGLDPARDRALIDAFRDLIDRVVVIDRPDGGVEAEVVGRIGPLVAEGLVSPRPLLGRSDVAEVRLSQSPTALFLQGDCINFGYFPN